MTVTRAVTCDGRGHGLLASMILMLGEAYFLFKNFDVIDAPLCIEESKKGSADCEYDRC